MEGRECESVKVAVEVRVGDERACVGFAVIDVGLTHLMRLRCVPGSRPRRSTLKDSRILRKYWKS